ncbi:MAG: malto-oligosyltrehalose synthase, partial [Sulfurifustaceae bacterium]
MRFDAPSPDRAPERKIDTRRHRLCRLCDIEPEYQDIWGNTHEISEETAHAILRAMGVEAAGRSLDDVIAEREALRWRRPVEVVQVLQAGAARETVLRLPESEAGRRVAYTLTREDGTIERHETRPANLRVIERAIVANRGYCAYALPLPELPLGYHQLALDASDASMALVVTPPGCYLPEALKAGSVWGVALQLYGLRSARNWGIGDFTDLRTAVDRFAEQGAGIIGVNPLHALFPHDAAQVSPYSPSSRMFLNVLYIDVEAIPEFSQCGPAQQLVYSAEFQRRLEQLRAAPRVDYGGVATAKLELLETLYQYFRDYHITRNTERAQAFRDFQDRGGPSLFRHALYEALQEHFRREDANVFGWNNWPPAFRRPDAPEVAQWAERQTPRIEYYQYLQWQADQQMSAVGRRSYDLGLGVGVYQDIAVSVNPGGAETWAWQSVYAQDVSVGAPPDEFMPNGQDWGLPPLIPSRLREAAYAPFITTLRANMHHGGALRLDHVMGLMRLFWVPKGTAPKDGAFVRYPLRDLLGIVALESQRNQCVVIGEDLGTVPEEIRKELPPRNIFSYRLLSFERKSDGSFSPPSAYPERALAAVTTHDLPTLVGYWKGRDLLDRQRLKQFPSEAELERQVMMRAQDRARLLMALEHEKLLPPGVTVDPASTPEMTPALAEAVYSYIARSPAKVAMLAIEDALGEECQPNLPGTVHEYPNWRRKLALETEEIVKNARALAMFGRLRDIRGSGIVVRPRGRPGGEPPIPIATYRLQFHRDFTFRDAQQIAPYLERLGVSHCYASPYLKARPGSRHGYDIVDHNALNPEIGSIEEYDAFVAALNRHRLGQVLDIVPNHMGIGSDNQWWLDVLENGPASLYAPFFDIDWRPLKTELRGKVLLPVLGDHYGRVLERGELKLAWDAETGSFHFAYYDHCIPVDPMTYPAILEHDVTRLELALGADHRRFVEYQSIVAGFRNLPGRGELEQERVIERTRDKEVHKRRLADLCAAEVGVGRHIEQVIEFYNGATGRDALHELLEGQAYRVAFWRVASDEINYRRFFDINDLAALRMEHAQCFYTTHRLVSSLIAQGKVNGLRVDHPDGLYDPYAYYERLQTFVTAAAATAGAAMAPTPTRNRGLYVVVEKILASHEYLPGDWPVHGTTGYDFLNLVNGLFVDAGAEDELTQAYARFARTDADFDRLLADRKRLIMRFALASELNVLANHLNRLSEADWYARDFTLTALRDALREVVAFFPVYRTYIRPGRVMPEDRRYIEWAVAQAKKNSTAADVSVFDFVRRILLFEETERLPESYRRAVLDFTQRFQQYTAPVMAKGMEDTAFYIYNRFVSLNEVGGDPRRFGLSVAAFHRSNQERAKRFPYSMLATSTHDTKRAEDVRARLNVISEFPREWRAAVNRWSRINRRKKRRLEDGYAPDRNDEYLLYQTLVGAWPLVDTEGEALDAFRARIEEYLLKAVREAKVHTSWINPNVEYEEAVRDFVRALLAPGPNLFVKDFLPFVRRVTVPGLCNSLAQTLLKITSPGVPDIYQGAEMWDFSLVDPDNRRAVDYVERAKSLQSLETELKQPEPERVRALLNRLEDGCAKLYVAWKALGRRRTFPELFRDGEYVPLNVEGARAEHLCAFARRHGQALVVIVVPRCVARLVPERELPLGAVWDDTWVEAPGEGAFENIFTGEACTAQQREEHAWLPAASLLNVF